MKKVEEKNFFLRGNFWQFSNKNIHIWDHFFPLLFPKDSESLKILDIRLREGGAKRPLNGTSKVTTHTDRRTDGQTDISTYRKHRPRGPMLWKEDNITMVSYFHIIHLYKQTMNQTKYFVPLLLTFNNQEKSIYVPKIIGHFSPFMLPLAVCQLNTS